MTPQTALDYARRFIGNMPINASELQLRICDDAFKRLWMAAPWRWSVGALPVTSLVNNQAAYNHATIADYAGIVQVRISTPQQQFPVEWVPVLGVASDVASQPTQLQYVTGPVNDTMTLSPVPTGYPVATMPKLAGVYKKKPVEMILGNLGSELEGTFGLPAVWQWVYQEIVLLKALQFANSPRAGNVTFNGGQAQFSGQMGAVEAAIAEMKRGEAKSLSVLGVPTNG